MHFGEGLSYGSTAIERLMFVEKQVKLVVEVCKLSVRSVQGQEVEKEQQQHIGVGRVSSSL
jgi:hypothetical protein